MKLYCMELDSYDKQLLNIIQNNSKITNQELADSVGLSPSACLRRMKTLEETGIIHSYKAILDCQKLGLNLTAIVAISMDKHTSERFAVFESEISQISEVSECLLITGQSADYQLHLTVRDLEHYQQILLGKITKIPGVSGVHSSFVLKKIITQRGIKL